jgi:hypothetical protein
MRWAWTLVVGLMLPVGGALLGSPDPGDDEMGKALAELAQVRSVFADDAEDEPAPAERERERAEQARARAEQERQRAQEQAERAQQLYEEAKESLDESDWQAAEKALAEVVALKGARADAALYWKAYALGKRGRRPEALASLEALRAQFSGSRWLKEAQALELELRAQGGEKPRPEALADEELKLMALDGLLRSDPDEAVPMLEKLLAGGASVRVKERALFVLSQSGSPRAKQIVGQVARGQGSPALQERAIEYLGIVGGAESRAILSEVYAQPSTDRETRKAVLQAFMIAGDRARVLQAAKGEKDPELQEQAVHLLGAMGARAELVELYRPETPKPVRAAVLEGLMIAGDGSRLVQVARTEKDPELRRQAVQLLSTMDSKEARAYLMEILEK